jgi:hypothetical protein
MLGAHERESKAALARRSRRADAELIAGPQPREIKEPIVQTLMRRTSLVLFVLLSAFLVAFGILYASVDAMLWFHAAAVPEPAREDVRPLYLALMKLIGGACVGLGLLSLYVTLGPLRAGARGAALALVLTFAVPVLMAAYVAETLAKLTGAPTSWHIMGMLLAFAALALVAHAIGRRNSSRILA